MKINWLRRPRSAGLNRLVRFRKLTIITVGEIEMRSCVIVLLAVLANFVLAGSGHAGPLDDAKDLGNGFHESPWFGIYNDSQYPWIYHCNFGWFYCGEQTAAALWCWDPAVGWFWINRNVYPAIYQQNRHWIAYDDGSCDPRWFYDFHMGNWINDSPVPQSESYSQLLTGGLSTNTYKVNNGNPVSVSTDDLDIIVYFDRYENIVSSLDLTEVTTIESNYSGQTLYKGNWYEINGFLTQYVRNQFGVDALGCYLLSCEMEMIHAMEVFGVSSLRSSFDKNIFGSPIIFFPGSTNLYKFPTWLPVNQWVRDCQYDGNFVSTINGVTQEEVDFSDTYTDKVTWEIIHKYPTYEIDGCTYPEVVQLRRSEEMTSQVDGEVNISTGHMYYAPGKGLIKFRYWHPMIPDSIEVTLADPGGWPHY